MATRTIKIYPTPEHAINTGKAEVPLKWALAYFHQLYHAVPEKFRDSVVLKGWADNEIWFVRELTKLEFTEEKKEQVITQLQAKVDAGQGLTPGQTSTLLDLLKAQP